MALDFFQNLYAEEVTSSRGYVLPCYFPELYIESLLRRVSIGEMPLCPWVLTKLQGTMGIMQSFTKERLWEVVGRSLCNMVKQTFQESELPHGINNTLIQLIPKVPSPQSITQFRPISLCNVTYNIIEGHHQDYCRSIEDFIALIGIPYPEQFCSGWAYYLQFYYFLLCSR